MKHLFLLLIVSFTLPSWALELTQYGNISSEQWAPANYPQDFKYDVLYYQPQSLKGKKNSKVLVFLHGGGASTVTRAGALSVSSSYISNLKSIADNLGFTLIVPSSSSLNWGGHTRVMLEALARELKQDKRFDAKRIGLSGHSMGGMGITRNFFWLADDFAFFL